LLISSLIFFTFLSSLVLIGVFSSFNPSFVFTPGSKFKFSITLRGTIFSESRSLIWKPFKTDVSVSVQTSSNLLKSSFLTINSIVLLIISAFARLSSKDFSKILLTSSKFSSANFVVKFSLFLTISSLTSFLVVALASSFCVTFFLGFSAISSNGGWSSTKCSTEKGTSSPWLWYIFAIFNIKPSLGIKLASCIEIQASLSLSGSLETQLTKVSNRKVWSLENRGTHNLMNSSRAVGEDSSNLLQIDLTIRSLYLKPGACRSFLAWGVLPISK